MAGHMEFVVRSLKRAALGAIFVGVATSAGAQESFNFDNHCIMGSFRVCASVRLSSTTTTVWDPISRRNSYVLTMDVWNLNGTLGVQHTMTSIGLYHAGSSFDWSGRINSYSVSYNGANITSEWTHQGANDIQTLGGMRLELREGTSGNSGIVGCTVPGGGTKWATCWNGGSSFPGDPFVRFTFNLSQQFSMNDVELRWHSQQLPDGSSLKCDTGGAGDYPDCIPNTQVPEPATLVLLGTGMAGVMGAARRRRRRSADR